MPTSISALETTGRMVKREDVAVAMEAGMVERTAGIEVEMAPGETARLVLEMIKDEELVPTAGAIIKKKRDITRMEIFLAEVMAIKKRGGMTARATMPLKKLTPDKMEAC